MTQWKEEVANTFVTGTENLGASVYQVNTNIWSGCAYSDKRNSPLDNYKTKEEAQKAALVEVEYLKKNS